MASVVAHEGWPTFHLHAWHAEHHFRVVSAKRLQPLYFQDHAGIQFFRGHICVKHSSSGEVGWRDFPVCRGDEHLCELSQTSGLESHTRGHVVATEAVEYGAAFFEGGVEAEAGDAAAGAVEAVFVAAHEDDGAVVFFDEAGAGDADDAGVPAGVTEDDGAFFGGGHAGGDGHGFGLFDDCLLHGAAFIVLAGEHFGDFDGAGAGCDGEEFEGFAGVAHAAAGVEAGAEFEADIFGGDLFAIETGA